LPGAFVFATNHFLKTYGKDLQFVVSSYYPKSQQGDFLGDQFGLLENNPDKALVGLIHTTRGDFWSDGDLTNPKVPRILAQLARAKLGQVDLYTADGGFGVEKRENLQERLSLPLIRGEIQTGFLALRPGGALLLKIFTYFTPEMLRYLEIIKRSFRSFDIVKPSTSAPMNSELYVIGIDYLGNGDVDMTVDSISPDIIEKRTQFVQSQIRELRSFVSGEGQTIPTFSPDWVAPISSDKQI